LVIKNIKDTTEQVNITNQIDLEIKKIYNSELPFAEVQDNTTQSVRGKLIQMHIKMEQNIKKVKSACEKAVRVCNKQNKGAGICGTCF